jgi:2-methylcitrate dehydratase PrpD
MSRAAPPLLDALADFAASASGATHQASIVLLAGDATIALLAGANCLEGQTIAAFMARTECSALANSARLAALLRLSEIDDIHRTSAVTASAIVLPAALAMRSVSGSPDPVIFRDALFVGRELSVRLAQAMGGAALLAHGLWPSYLVAPFGAAATTARLLGLAPARMGHALALALAQTPHASGRPLGTRPGRWLLFGNAVRAGCLAALAAADGVDGDPELLSQAWLQSVGAANADASRLADSAYLLAAIETTSLKPHCCAKQGLAAVHGLRQLLKQGLDPASIEAIEVAVPGAYAGMLDRGAAAAGRLASIVNLPRQLALAALRPGTLDDVDRTSLQWEPHLLAFASRVTVRADASLDHYYPEKWPARVVLTSRGQQHEIFIEDSPGDPALPFDTAAVQDKARRILPAPAGLQLVDRVLGMQLTAAAPGSAADTAVLDALSGLAARPVIPFF